MSEIVHFRTMKDDRYYISKTSRKNFSALMCIARNDFNHARGAMFIRTAMNDVTIITKKTYERILEEKDHMITEIEALSASSVIIFHPEFATMLAFSASACKNQLIARTLRSIGLLL